MTFNLDEKYIVEAEMQLNARLPMSYKNSMLKNNGGTIKLKNDCWEQYPIFDKSDRKRISRTCNHIISETRSCEGFGDFPNNAIAIAGNGSGDQLIIQLEDSVFSSAVYLWSHETGEIEKVASEFHELSHI